jgi:PAS domain S-box-containing protein
MNAQVIPYMLVLLFATVISFILAAYSFLKRTIPAARFFGSLAAGIGIWSLCYLFEVVNLLLRLKQVFFALKYIGIVLVPISLLAFVMEYTGISLRRVLKLLPFLLIEPLIILALLFSNPFHGWFYINPRLEIAKGFIVLAFTPQIWYYINSAYSVLLALISLSLILRYYKISAGFRRRQILVFMLGGIVPVGVMLLILSGVARLPSLDFTSIAMVASLPFLAISVFQYRLLDVVPEARDLAIEFMDDCVIVINRRFRVLDLNPAAQTLFGVKAVEVIGQALEELLPLSPELRAGITQPERFQKDIEITRDGQAVQFELRSFRLASWYGRPAGRLVLLHDVTETKQLENSLRQAKDAAEEATRSKSLFLASMSHEIRTPLNAVIGMTSLLQDTPLDAEQREFVSTIRAGSDALLTSINDILDFSKIEAGRLELETQSFNLAGCVEDAMDILAPQASAKNLELFYAPADNLPAWVKGDPTRLRQVLVNLLSNAVKFTELGEVVVRSQVENEQEGMVQLHFSVTDTGIGIPARHLDRVFETFTQADASIARRYGGTGLGLTISSRLVHIMGGRIWAESQEGKGSTFHFTLQVEKARPQPDALSGIRGDLLVGKRVLVVDDNATNRTILLNQMKAWGMKVEAVESARQALTWLQSSPNVDLILLDMNLPDMDGAELARNIRQQLGLEQTPLILLSSMAQRSAESDRPLFAAIQNKPIRAAQLYDLLAGILTNQTAIGQGLVGEPPAPIFDATFSNRHPLHILLAEDNPVNKRVAVGFLERLGYQIDTVANGLEAVEAVRRQPYDLVLMDVRMPEMDGLDATRKIRAELSPERQPRIVAMTAYAYQEELAECLAAGMDDFLTKPIQNERLAAILTKHTPMSPVEDAEDPAAALHPAHILDELGDDREEIIGLLLNNLDERFNALQAAWEAGDAPRVREYAHQLKTDSGYLGADQLAQVMLAMERSAIAGILADQADMQQAESLVRQLRESYNL